MPHKTLYIDIDEEITSIVDRMRKAQANEIIVVVPKKALLIQSLVNLKLLKKEADRRKKRLMIVTQDRIGKKLIEKAGIMVQGKMDETLTEEEIVQEKPTKVLSETPEVRPENDLKKEPIGSSDYFDEPLPVPPAKSNIGKISYEKKDEKIVRKEDLASQKKLGKLARSKSQRAKKESRVSMSDIVAGPVPRKEKKERNKLAAPDKKEAISDKYNFQFREAERQKNLQAEKYFLSPSFSSQISSRKEQKALKVTRVKGKSGKYFVIFLATFLALGIAAGVYYFLPRATIVLHLKGEEKSVSKSIEANVQTKSVEADKIPAVLEQITREKSGEFEATGSKTGAGKATGKVVIYNEFGADNQPLVVTTRLETSDGKIFRITKNIVVPGLTQVGGEMKPGAIEVDVVADKPGEEYNIEPTTFKIPGFKGGPKYDKFYAKSSKAMEGGARGESPVVTSQDVAQAKEALVSKARQEALEELKDKLGQGKIFFEDAVKFELQNSSTPASVGTQTEKFTYRVTELVQTLSFSENDVKKLISDGEKSSQSGLLLVTFEKNLNYIMSESDIEKGFVKFEAKTDVSTAGGLDIENFKKGVLGKNSQELENFMKNYPTIKSADVNFWPFFVNRVPMNEGRVEIEVE